MSTLLRKFIASASVVTLLSTLLVSTVAFAASFDDVAEGDIWYDAVEQAVSDGIIDEGGDFGPFDVGTRAIMADWSVAAAEFSLITPATPSFTDVPVSYWAYSQIETGFANGMWQGYGDGRFGPEDALTRGQAAIILVNTYQPSDPPADYMSACDIFPDVACDHYAADAIRTAYYWSYINGYENGDFGPNDTLVKYQIAIMHNNARYYAEARPEGPVQVSGNITIAAAANMPVGMTVPISATNVNFMSFKMTAGSEGATVDGVTFSRQGVGAASDFDNVYIYEGNNKLTSGRSVNSSDNTAEFSSLNWVFAPFESRTFQLRADISSTASAANEHRFFISDVEGTDAGGEVNLAGPYMRIGGETAGDVTIERNGTIANPTLGDKGARISQFKLTMNGEDGIVKWVNLYLTGTISLSEISNFKLYKGTTVSEANLVAVQNSVSSRDTVNFDLGDGLSIDDGDDQIFTVTADLDADADDTVTTYIDETTDVYAVGEVFQTGLAVTNSFDSTTTHSVTLQGGEVTLSFAGPVAKDISIDSTKQTFMDFILSTDRDIEVKQLLVDVDDRDSEQTGSGTCDNDAVDPGDLLNAATSANLKNIRIMEGTKNLMETESLSLVGSDCSQTLTFTDSFFMDAGDKADLSINMDVDDDAQTDKIRVQLQAVSTSAGIKDVSSNKFVTDIVPTSAIVGNTMSLVSSTLSISLASTPVSDTYVKGTQNVALVGFLWKTGSSESVEVTSLTLTGYLDGTTADPDALVAGGTDGGTTVKDTVNNIRLYESGYAADKTPIAGPEGVEDDGTVIFTDMSYVIPTSTTRRVVVVGDISTSAFADTDGEYLSFDIADVSADVTAEDSDGDTVGVTDTDAVNGGTNPNVYITTTDTGGLTVKTKASTTPSSNIVIAGRTDVELARFEFAATTEDISVNDITLGYAAGTPADGGSDEVISISVFDKDDRTTPLGTGYVNSGVVDLNDLGLIVPANDKAVLVVTADLNSIQNNADSGTVIAVFLKSVDEAQGGAGEDVTVAVDSNVSATGCAGDIDTVGGTTNFTATQTVITTAACSSVSVGDILEITGPVNDDIERILVIDKDTDDDANEVDWTVIRNVGGGSAIDWSVQETADLTFSADIDVFKAQSSFMVVRETKPTFATVPYASTKKLQNGSNQGLYKFTVKAEAEEDIEIATLVFEVTGQLTGDALGLNLADVACTTVAVNGLATGGADGLTTDDATDCDPTGAGVHSASLYDVTDGETVANTTIWYDNQGTTAKGYIIVEFGTAEEVNAAGKTYELRASVAGVANNGDYISVLIPETTDATYLLVTGAVDTARLDETSGLTDAAANAIDDDVVWSDNSDITNDPRQDFTNGYLLKSLKTDASTLTFTTS